MSTWIDTLQPRCGPLSEAARRFAVTRGFGGDPPRGVPALRDLLAAIRQQYTRDDNSDDRFIEDAGAFLGLVLAERFASVRHVSHGTRHGLQLGMHGFFDPFACIARSLEADRPADALLACLAEAEDEAHARSHGTRIIGALARCLLARGSALRIEQRVGDRIWLRDGPDVMEVDLSGLLSVTAGETETESAEIVQRFSTALLGQPGGSNEPWPSAARRLLPRVVGDAFRRRLRQAGRLPTLQRRPLCGELQVALVLQYEGRARYVGTGDLAHWGISAETAEQTAVDNLRKRPIRLHVLGQGEQQLVQVRTGDGYDAARVLLPEVQQALADTLGLPLAVALPHRDCLLACRAATGPVRAHLDLQAKAEAARAPHAVSAALWQIGSPGQFAPFAL